MKILVVEDDPAIGKALHNWLIETGHQCTWLKTGKQLSNLDVVRQFDCIILDVMLPDSSGLDTLAELRNGGLKTPVIVLTALGSVDERVRGLNTGADDYIVKPFAFAELMARVEAVCRRTTAKPTMNMTVGNLQLDLATRRVRFNDQTVELTPTESSLLEMLMRYAGHVVTRKMLCEHLWEFDWEGTTNVIDVHITRLRGKLERLSPDKLIHTVRGQGYALHAA